MRRRAAFVLAAVLLAGCGTVSGGTGFVEGEPTLTRLAPNERPQAPVLTGATVDGQPFSTQSAQGKVVVVNVWGSWCAPCRKEAPDLESAWQQTSSVAQFVGINTRDTDVAQAKAFQRGFAVTYPSFYDPKGELLLKFPPGQVSPGAIPTTLVIDKQGRIAARVIGITTTATLVGLVTDVAAGR